MPGWGLALLAVAAGAVVLVALDRAVARGWFDGVRLSVRSPRDARGGGAGGGFLGDLVEIFQPTRVHLVAEQERQELDIVREGDAAPPTTHPSRPQDSEPTVA